MTPTEIRKAGYIIEAWVPGGSNQETKRKPWVIRCIGQDHGMYGSRYAKRRDAVAALAEELASPDSSWPRAGE